MSDSIACTVPLGRSPACRGTLVLQSPAGETHRSCFLPPVSRAPRDLRRATISLFVMSIHIDERVKSVYVNRHVLAQYDAAMPPLAARYATYAEAHRSAANRACHAVGWPFIGAGVAGMLARVAVGPVDGGWVFLGALWISWVVVEPWLALALAPGMVVVHLAGAALPVAADVALFVAGNAIPIAGHVFVEKNAPATLREGVVGTWLGPLFSLRSLLRRP